MERQLFYYHYYSVSFVFFFLGKSTPTVVHCFNYQSTVKLILGVESWRHLIVVT